MRHPRSFISEREMLPEHECRVSPVLRDVYRMRVRNRFTPRDDSICSGFNVVLDSARRASRFRVDVISAFD